MNKPLMPPMTRTLNLFVTQSSCEHRQTRSFRNLHIHEIYREENTLLHSESGKRHDNIIHMFTSCKNHAALEEQIDICLRSMADSYQRESTSICN